MSGSNVVLPLFPLVSSSIKGSPWLVLSVDKLNEVKYKVSVMAVAGIIGDSEVLVLASTPGSQWAVTGRPGAGVFSSQHALPPEYIRC